MIGFRSLAARSETFNKQLPHALGENGGFVGIVAGFHAQRVIAVEDVDRKARGGLSRDRYTAEGARFPERLASSEGDWMIGRHQRPVIVTRLQLCNAKDNPQDSSWETP